MLRNKILGFVSVLFFVGGLQARGGGEAFGGALAGSFLGSAITSAATRPSSSDNSGLRRKVAELHDALIKMDRAVTDKINEMNKKVEKLEQELNDLKKDSK